MKLCSACLLGINCRYDANPIPHQKVLQLAKTETLIPICPEQLGGLPTPRIPSEQRGDQVFSQSGTDVTHNFSSGATEALKIAKIYGIKEAILKQNSPSCGCSRIYDGSFSGKIINGEGITAKLLREHNINVISEEEL